MTEYCPIPQPPETSKNPEQIELNPLRYFIKLAASDIGSLFEEKLGILDSSQIGDLEKRTNYLYLPGQALAVGIEGALAVDEQNTYVQESGYSEMEVKAMELVRGLFTAFWAGGFRDKILNRNYISLVPPLSALLPLALAGPETCMVAGSIITLLRAVDIPYLTYHEMIHQIEAQNFVTEYMNKITETFTDFWVREVTKKSKHFFGGFANSYANTAVTAYLGWPTSMFDRKTIDGLVTMMAEKSGSRDSVLAELGLAYVENTWEHNLLSLLDGYTQNRGEEVLDIFNSKDKSERKVHDIKKCFL